MTDKKPSFDTIVREKALAGIKYLTRDQAVSFLKGMSVVRPTEEPSLTLKRGIRRLQEGDSDVDDPNLFD